MLRNIFRVQHLNNDREISFEGNEKLSKDKRWHQTFNTNLKIMYIESRHNILLIHFFIRGGIIEKV